jgi:hypothetical protein
MSDIHVYGAMSDGEVGIILALPEDSTIRNPEGALTARRSAATRKFAGHQDG